MVSGFRDWQQEQRDERKATKFESYNPEFEGLSIDTSRTKKVNNEDMLFYNTLNEDNKKMLNTNIEQSKSKKWYNPNDAIWFYNQVRNKGPWDYKQKDKKNENFGNFNFGANANAMGWPREVAKMGAGIAQKIAGTDGNNTWLNSYWDDPNDQNLIDLGYDYYDKVNNNKK